MSKVGTKKDSDILAFVKAITKLSQKQEDFMKSFEQKINSSKVLNGELCGSPNFHSFGLIGLDSAFSMRINAGAVKHCSLG